MRCFRYPMAVDTLYLRLCAYNTYRPSPPTLPHAPALLPFPPSTQSCRMRRVCIPIDPSLPKAGRRRTGWQWSFVFRVHLSSSFYSGPLSSSFANGLITMSKRIMAPRNPFTDERPSRVLNHSATERSSPACFEATRNGLQSTQGKPV